MTSPLTTSHRHFDYITSRRQGTVYVRKSHGIDNYPEELKNKVYLLKHFERYIMDRLYGDYEYAFEDSGGRTVATVSKRWFSWTDSYGVEIADGADEVLILAATVVIDLRCHGDKKH